MVDGFTRKLLMRHGYSVKQWEECFQMAEDSLGGGREQARTGSEPDAKLQASKSLNPKLLQKYNTSSDSKIFLRR
jgi:hypothetical protein